jgi:hypothetical protein
MQGNDSYAVSRLRRATQDEVRTVDIEMMEEVNR